jgi:hypothetical protein
MRRYDRASLLALGKFYGTYVPSAVLRAAAVTKAIDVKIEILQENQRLEHIAGKEYGNSNLWWIIAGCSGIGWSLQVPPGTMLLVPTDLSQISSLL